MKRQFRCIADPDDHIPLPRVLLTGKQFVAVSLRDIRLEERDLLSDPVLFHDILDVSAEGGRVRDHTVFVLLNISAVLLRMDLSQHLFQLVRLFFLHDKPPAYAKIEGRSDSSISTFKISLYERIMNMDLSDRLAVSYYKTVAPINELHNVDLVRHQVTGRLCVRKTLDVYSSDIYSALYRHPVKGIPRILATCEENGKLTVIEEFISGCTLLDLIESTRKAGSPDTGTAAEDVTLYDKLTVSSIGRYMIQLCEILERIHSLDPPLIHRDLKPSNIMITNCDNVILLDFNAARYYTGSTSQGQDTRLLGTQGYAAPEQYGFRESSPRTDLYSVGRILEEAVASLPVRDHTFDTVIDKCTQMDPSGRYPSAGALKAALEKCLARYEYRTSPDRSRTVNPYLPPGMRTLTPWKMLFAFVTYVAVFQLCLTMQIEKAEGVGLWFQRIAVLIIFLIDILVANNYLGIQKIAPFSRNPNRAVRILGVVLLMAIVTLALFFILIFIVGFFFVPV